MYSRIAGHAGRPHWKLCYLIFDVIYIEGARVPLRPAPVCPNLMASPWHQRRQVLSQVVRQRPGLFEIVGVETDSGGAGAMGGRVPVRPASQQPTLSRLGLCGAHS